MDAITDTSNETKYNVTGVPVMKVGNFTILEVTPDGKSQYNDKMTYCEEGSNCEVVPSKGGILTKRIGGRYNKKY